MRATPGRAFAPIVIAALAGLAGFARSAAQSASSPYVQLRLAGDSGVVGHYKFTADETQRIVFDLPPDDPRASLLQNATGPWKRHTEIAATMVALPDAVEDVQRYLLYWLGYRLAGDEVRSLTPLQWDSIFRAAGRRATLRLSARGEPRGVSVTSDAVRPVGQALAELLASMGTSLPEDSVTVGNSWHGGAALPVRRPDGRREMKAVDVVFRLRAIAEEPDGLRVARIEFDGEPRSEGPDRVTGRYFGEAVFAIAEGRYERMMAVANLEVVWAETGGLPPSRSVLQWQGRIGRAGP